MSKTNCFENADRISRIENPLDWTEEKTAVMVRACREMATFHRANCSDIDYLYTKHKFDPQSIATEEDLQRIPMLGVSAMKTFLLTSLPHEKAVLKLTSSGTRGQKTQIWFDQESLDRVQAMLDGVWSHEGLVSKKPTNYVMFVYDPEEAKDLGIAFSDKNQQRFAPAHRVFYTIKKNRNGDWEFLLKETIEALQNFSKDGKPVRLFGIPSFIFEMLNYMHEKEIKISLPPESMMMTGGGWKAAEDKKVTREAFRKMIVADLGIKDELIRDGYGMAEHSAPYDTCEKHRLHIPVFNRIYARNPETLEVLPSGQIGLLELITPFNAMMPNLAILTTDLGFIDEADCPCGHRSPTFTLVGRGGIAKHKGCAIHASDIIKRA